MAVSCQGRLLHTLAMDCIFYRSPGKLNSAGCVRGPIENLPDLASQLRPRAAAGFSRHCRTRGNATKVSVDIAQQVRRFRRLTGFLHRNPTQHLTFGLQHRFPDVQSMPDVPNQLLNACQLRIINLHRIDGLCRLHLPQPSLQLSDLDGQILLAGQHCIQLPLIRSQRVPLSCQDLVITFDAVFRGAEGSKAVRQISLHLAREYDTVR